MFNSAPFYQKWMSDPNDYTRLTLYHTINDLLDDTTKKFADYIALADKDKEISYQTLSHDIAKARAYFIKQGVKKGDRVGLLIPNEYNFVKSFLALMSLGVVVAVIPTSLTGRPLIGTCQKFNLSMVVYHLSTKSSADEARAILTNIKFVAQDDVNLEQEEKAGNKVNPNDPACIVFTGGTTGTPKGALLSHQNLCCGAFNGCLVPGKVFHLRYVSLIPFSHVFGLVRNLLSNFVSGSTLYIISNPSTFVQEMNKAQPEVMILTPALVRLVYNLAKLYGLKIFGPNFKSIIAGGAPVPPELILAVNKLGINCYQGYGSTESTNLVSGNGEPYKRPNSVGLPYPNQEVKLIDGEICVKGPNVFLGYYHDEEATKKVLKDGWLYTGDLGKIDEDNYLYIIGRKSNLIVLPNGLKFSPEEVEALINKCPIVTDSVVYYDAKIDMVVAEVFCKDVPSEKSEPVVNEYINNTVNQELVSHARIKKVVIRLQDFKRSPAYKIIREAH